MLSNWKLREPEGVTQSQAWLCHVISLTTTFKLLHFLLLTGMQSDQVYPFPSGKRWKVSSFNFSGLLGNLLFYLLQKVLII